MTPPADGWSSIVSLAVSWPGSFTANYRGKINWPFCQVLTQLNIIPFFVLFCKFVIWR